MSADIWIVIIEDRHADVEARPFGSEERAVKFARVMGERSDGATPEPLTPGMREAGWVLCVPYGTEGDRIRVVKRTMDGAR